MVIFLKKALIRLLLLVPVLSQAQVRVGQVAPTLSFSDVIQGRFLGQQNGNPILLEFWATWCGPCVQNIPHLNELAKKFEVRGLQFISITPEEALVVQKFLGTHPLVGIVALDHGQAMFNRYGAGTPTTVLIDRSGRVVRKVHPSQITADSLEDLISDRPVRLSAIRDDMYPPLGGGPLAESENDSSTILKVTLSPSTQVNPLKSLASSDLPEHVKAGGETLPALLQFAYDLRPQQINISKYFQGGYYAVDAWVPIGQGAFLKPLLQTTLAASIGYTTHMEEREFDTLVLEGWPGKLQPAKDHSYQKSAGLLAADGWPLSTLIQELEHLLKMPIVLYNSPKGVFRWHLQWDAEQPHALEEALQEQLGLRLRRERTLLPVLTVE